MRHETTKHHVTGPEAVITEDDATNNVNHSPSLSCWHRNNSSDSRYKYKLLLIVYATPASPQLI